MIAPAAARLAQHQAGRDTNGFSGGDPALDHLDEQLHGAVAHAVQGDAHAAEGRLLHGALRSVVEPDHRHVLGNAPIGLGQGLNGAKGRLIVAGKHSREGCAAGENLAHRRVAHRVDVPAVGHQPRISREAVGAQGHLVRAQPVAAIAIAILRAAGDEGDPTVAVANKVRHRRQNAAGVIGGERRPTLAGADELHGVAVGDHSLDVAREGRQMQGVDRDQAISVPGADRDKVGSGRGDWPSRAQRVACGG